VQVKGIMKGTKMLDFNYVKAVELAKSHKRLFHYTTFEALNSIISNKSLLLKRIDKLNDAVENERLLDLWKKKVFVSCFTYRDYESYFFWQSYAKGSHEGVMLSFDSSLMNNMTIHPDAKCQEPELNKYDRTDDSIEFSSLINSYAWGIYDKSLVDIMYIPRNIKIHNNDNFQGRFKYAEWDMELETRIRISVRPRCFEARTVKTEIEYLTPENEYIFAKLSNDCIEAMSITLSPFANQELNKKVNELLIKNDLYDKIKVKRSVLTKEMNNI